MKQEDVFIFLVKALLEEIKKYFIKKMNKLYYYLIEKAILRIFNVKIVAMLRNVITVQLRWVTTKVQIKYKCNYCGKQIYYTGKCTKCGSTNLIHSGKGIERIEEELKKYFDVPIIKVDSELSRNKDYFSRIYKDFLW